MDINPYSAPAAQNPSDFGVSVTSQVSAAAVQPLAATKPWIRMMAIIGG